MRPDGRIRGVRRIIVRRKGRNPTEVFELRINIPWEDEIRRTTLSIDVHGFEKAFNMAVEKVAEWYGLASDSEAKKAMKGSYDVYRLQTDPQANSDRVDKKVDNLCCFDALTYVYPSELASLSYCCDNQL